MASFTIRIEDIEENGKAGFSLSCNRENFRYIGDKVLIPSTPALQAFVVLENAFKKEFDISLTTMGEGKPNG